MMWCDVMWCDVMWCDVMWCDVIWCEVMWCDVMWCDVMWCDVMWCDVMWCDVMWCDVMWCNVTWCGMVCLDYISRLLQWLHLSLTMAATAADADPPPGEGVRLPSEWIKSCNVIDANVPILLLPITYLKTKIKGVCKYVYMHILLINKIFRISIYTVYKKNL